MSYVVVVMTEGTITHIAPGRPSRPLKNIATISVELPNQSAEIVGKATPIPLMAYIDGRWISRNLLFAVKHPLLPVGWTVSPPMFDGSPAHFIMRWAQETRWGIHVAAELAVKMELKAQRARGYRRPRFLGHYALVLDGKTAWLVPASVVGRTARVSMGPGRTLVIKIDKVFTNVWLGRDAVVHLIVADTAYRAADEPDAVTTVPYLDQSIKAVTMADLAILATLVAMRKKFKRREGLTWQKVALVLGVLAIIAMTVVAIVHR